MYGYSAIVNRDAKAAYYKWLWACFLKKVPIDLGSSRLLISKTELCIWDFQLLAPIGPMAPIYHYLVCDGVSLSVSAIAINAL